jgi:LacI family transcriptional regulator
MKKMSTILSLLDKERIGCRRILRGLMRYSQLHSLCFLQKETFLYSSNLDDPKRLIDEARPDGIIAYIRKNDPLLQLIRDMEIPAVLIPSEEPVPGFPNHLEVSEKTGAMGADYLLSKGLVHFGFIGFNDLYWSRVRHKGFVNRIECAGFIVHTYDKIPTVKHCKSKDEQIKVVKWLKTLPQPIGILCCNDDMAGYVSNACGVAELNIPDDVSILGVDNDEFVCESYFPKISSIVMNHESVGYETGECLDSLMQGNKWDGRNIFLHPTHVLSRQSTDLLMIEDPDVVVAIRFMESACPQGNICVQDVIDHTKLSRRVLEKRFRRYLNCSIYAKIQTIRMEMFCKLLRDTDISVSQIGRKMGFTEIKNISKYFRDHQNMTPLQYRRMYGSNPTEPR